MFLEIVEDNFDNDEPQPEDEQIDNKHIEIQDQNYMQNIASSEKEPIPNDIAQTEIYDEINVDIEPNNSKLDEYHNDFDEEVSQINNIDDHQDYEVDQFKEKASQIQMPAIEEVEDSSDKLLFIQDDQVLESTPKIHSVESSVKNSNQKIENISSDKKQLELDKIDSSHILEPEERKVDNQEKFEFGQETDKLKTSQDIKEIEHQENNQELEKFDKESDNYENEFSQEDMNKSELQVNDEEVDEPKCTKELSQDGHGSHNLTDSLEYEHKKVDPEVDLYNVTQSKSQKECFTKSHYYQIEDHQSELKEVEKIRPDIIEQESIGTINVQVKDPQIQDIKLNDSQYKKTQAEHVHDEDEHFKVEEVKVVSETVKDEKTDRTGNIVGDNLFNEDQSNKEPKAQIINRQDFHEAIKLEVNLSKHFHILD